MSENSLSCIRFGVRWCLPSMFIYHLNNSTKFETTALYYDKYGRVVQSRATNHLLGYDLVYNELKFTGAPARTLKTHGINGATDTYKELYTYDYDKAQRPTTTKYSLNGSGEVTLASNTYDELGRLKTKTLGGIDATTYSYNVRSWTTDIVGSRFSENLYYNTGPLNGANACYNGNIAAMQWSVANDNLNYNRAYSFTYDDLNRLTNANYYGFSNGSMVSGTTGLYNETLDYMNDKMGNIHGITRNENGTQVESLGLQYQGNQLQKVDNGISHFISYGSELFKDYDNHIVIPTEYAYDTNGNMLYDANGGVSAIQYNVLNLPDKIHFAAGHKNLYTYDASGHKLRTVNYSSNQILDIPMNTITPLSSTPSDYTVLTTDYVGNIIYENGALKEILLPEGYYKNGTYYYYLKDHLGNNRVTINSSGTVVEKSHYYPSGTRFFPESTSDSSVLAYRYNGKEMETMNGLNQMDYGARRRYSGLPIWTGPDELREKYYSISPYAYCLNNPMRFIDPDGKEVLNGMNKNDNKNLPILKAITRMRANEDPNVIHLYAHGNKNGLMITTGKGENTKDIDIDNANDLKGFLKINSKVWNNRKNNENVTIVLHACETGKETDSSPESFAQRLSQDMPNVTIIAPTEKIAVDQDGSNEVSAKTKKNADGTEIKVELGRYSEFKDSKKTHVYDGDDQPGTKKENK